MSLECSICLDSYRKLKRLRCQHTFCSSCLSKLQRQSSIRCPYCRQDTDLSPLGIEDLISQFGGKIQCTECESDLQIRDGFWCASCQSILCQLCTQNAQGHEGLEPIDRAMAPVAYCVRQLDELAAVHTKLTMLQKKLIAEYVRQLGQAFQRQLDDDLAARLRIFKAEKQFLRKTFDLDPLLSQRELNEEQSREKCRPCSISGNDDSSKQHSFDPAAQFASVFKSVYRLSKDFEAETSSGNSRGAHRRCKFDLPNKGIFFNPPTIEKMTDLCMANGRFACFSASLHTLRKNQRKTTDDAQHPTHVRKTPPLNYFGSGILDDPCDLCVIPERNVLLVSCVNGGIYSFLMDDDPAERQSSETGKPLVPFKKYPPKTDRDQMISISYDAENRYIAVTVLRDYRQWFVQIYERRGMRLRAETPCPNDEPAVRNSWYRWVTCVARGHALVTTGDRQISVAWLLNLHNQRWTVLLKRPNATFRKASFHRPARSGKHEGLVYVPDLENKSIVTMLLDTKTWQISKLDEIKTPEFERELPLSVNAMGGRLVVGYWNTGNVVYADLFKATSFTLTSVGPRELFNTCFVDPQSLLILCKQKEVVELYRV